MRKKGFSVLEIAVVCMVILIILAFSFPIFIPEKIKYDLYATGLVNLIYKAKMSAIFNLYQTTIVYDRTTGIFTLFLDENGNRARDQNEKIIDSFPDRQRYLRNSRTVMSRFVTIGKGVSVEIILSTTSDNSSDNSSSNPPQDQNEEIPENIPQNGEITLISFNRLGFANSVVNEGIITYIYLQNPRVTPKYRYQYVIRMTRGGDIALLKVRI
ncbi:MAG: hypothetical protein ABDH21_00405 [bacterium]